MASSVDNGQSSRVPEGKAGDGTPIIVEVKSCWLNHLGTNGSVHAATGLTGHSTGARTAVKRG
jgi:hypothetical protein